MNPYLPKLQPYPFERLGALRQAVTPPADRPLIDFSIGEPKHATPAFIKEALLTKLDELARYPLTAGSDALRSAIADWLTRRFQLAPQQLDPGKQVLPVNGTREALFAFAQCVVNTTGTAKPLVVMPNPFYQIYEGATLLAGAEPRFIPCTPANNYLPDFTDVPVAVWERCQLCYICTPGNPSGTTLSLQHFQKLLELADRYDFIIASDECYSEIYADEAHPPMGLLQAASLSGRDRFERCIVFHSLSKRSSVPGLRSGFVAGNEQLIQTFLRYRTYHGCAMPMPTQAASIAAWQDEAHVQENRRLYREKFAAVTGILAPYLNVQRPEGGFYFWQPVPIDDVEFTRRLYQQGHVLVLPGTFLARSADNGDNPGRNHVRIALVAPPADCVTAAERIATFIQSI